MDNRLAHAGARIATILGVLVAALVLMLAPARPARADGLVTDCTEQGLADAMNAGSGLITFDCGPNPVVINMTLQNGGLNVVSGNADTIDGGDKVTLTGAGAQRLFDVRVNAALTLTHIILTNGYAATLGNLPDWGGAILDEGDRLVLDHVTIRDSQSAFAGGAIRVVTGTAVIQNSLIENNQSDYGGAIDSLGAVVVLHSIIRNNTATAGGGGLSLGGLTIIDQSQIYTNTADGAGGGGLYLTAPSHVTVTDSQIYSNTAPDSSSRGGGIENFGAFTFAGGSLTGNSASIGGGLSNEGGATATLGSLSLSGNVAASFSGGVYNKGTLILTNVTVSGNTVPGSGSGGGLGLDGGATTTVVNSTFAGNRAGSGGALSNSGALTLLNDTFSCNTATIDGGGLEALVGSAITLLNDTLSGNASPQGGGIEFDTPDAGDSVTFKNTLVADSPAGGNCYVDPGSVKGITSAGFNLSSDNTCAAYFNQAGDQNSQPARLFPLANNGGRTLTHLPQHASLAIDHGAGLGCPAADQRGLPRPSGAACDIGAVEVQPTDRAWPLYLPALGR